MGVNFITKNVCMNKLPISINKTTILEYGHFTMAGDKRTLENSAHHIIFNYNGIKYVWDNIDSFNEDYLSYGISIRDGVLSSCMQLELGFTLSCPNNFISDDSLTEDCDEMILSIYDPTKPMRFILLNILEKSTSVFHFVFINTRKMVFTCIYRIFFRCL